jgi:hypothetical protein
MFVDVVGDVKLLIHLFLLESSQVVVVAVVEIEAKTLIRFAAQK